MLRLLVMFKLLFLVILCTVSKAAGVSYQSLLGLSSPSTDTATEAETTLSDKFKQKNYPITSNDDREYVTVDVVQDGGTTLEYSITKYAYGDEGTHDLEYAPVWWQQQPTKPMHGKDYFGGVPTVMNLVYSYTKSSSLNSDLYTAYGGWMNNHINADECSEKCNQQRIGEHPDIVSFSAETLFLSPYKKPTQGLSNNFWCRCFSTTSSVDKRANYGAVDLSDTYQKTLELNEPDDGLPTIQLAEHVSDDHELKTTEDSPAWHSENAAQYEFRQSSQHDRLQYLFYCPAGYMYIPDFASRVACVTFPTTDEPYGESGVYIGVCPKPGITSNKPCLKCPKGTFHQGSVIQGGILNTIKIMGVRPKPGDAQKPLVCQHCPTGFYADQEGSTSCKRCGESEPYSNRDLTGCFQSCANGIAYSQRARDCNAGMCMQLGQKYTSDGCISCSPGKYMDGRAHQTLECKSCPLGYYSSAPGAGSCTRCAGKMAYTTNQSGAAAASECKTVIPGKMIRKTSDPIENIYELKNDLTVGGIDDMIDVQPPFYSDGTNVHLCPTGSLTMIPGATSEANCTSCPAGKATVEGDRDNPETTCEDCPAGKSGRVRNNGMSVCVDCPRGKFLSGPGTAFKRDRSECTLCTSHNNGVDSYSDEYGMQNGDSCKLCSNLPDGRFCRKAGEPYYGLEIPSENHTTTTRRSIFDYYGGGEVMGPRLSNVGTNATDGVAAACSQGFYQDENEQGSCKECPNGYATDSDRSIRCKTCAVGKYIDNGACVYCLGGKYMTAEAVANANRGVDQCKPCGVGLSSNANRTACVSCEAGRFREWNKSAETCDTCYPATIAPEDETVCQKPLNLGSTSYVYNCDGSCRNDADGDGICDLYETISLGGCTNSSSCNFNPLATIDDGTCLVVDNKETCASLCGRFRPGYEQCDPDSRIVYDAVSNDEPECTLVKDAVTGHSCLEENYALVPRRDPNGSQYNNFKNQYVIKKEDAEILDAEIQTLINGPIALAEDLRSRMNTLTPYAKILAASSRNRKALVTQKSADKAAVLANQNDLSSEDDYRNKVITEGRGGLDTQDLIPSLIDKDSCFGMAGKTVNGRDFPNTTWEQPVETARPLTNVYPEGFKYWRYDRDSIAGDFCHQPGSANGPFPKTSKGCKLQCAEKLYDYEPTFSQGTDHSTATFTADEKVYFAVENVVHNECYCYNSGSCYFAKTEHWCDDPDQTYWNGEFGGGGIQVMVPTNRAYCAGYSLFKPRVYKVKMTATNAYLPSGCVEDRDNERLVWTDSPAVSPHLWGPVCTDEFRCYKHKPFSLKISRAECDGLNHADWNVLATDTKARLSPQGSYAVFNAADRPPGCVLRHTGSRVDRMYNSYYESSELVHDLEFLGTDPDTNQTYDQTHVNFFSVDWLRQSLDVIKNMDKAAADTKGSSQGIDFLIATESGGTMHGAMTEDKCLNYNHRSYNWINLPDFVATGVGSVLGSWENRPRKEWFAASIAPAPSPASIAPSPASIAPSPASIAPSPASIAPSPASIAPVSCEAACQARFPGYTLQNTATYNVLGVGALAGTPRGCYGPHNIQTQQPLLLFSEGPVDGETGTIQKLPLLGQGLGVVQQYVCETRPSCEDQCIAHFGLSMANLVNTTNLYNGFFSGTPRGCYGDTANQGATNQGVMFSPGAVANGGAGRPSDFGMTRVDGLCELTPSSRRLAASSASYTKKEVGTGTANIETFCQDIRPIMNMSETDRETWLGQRNIHMFEQLIYGASYTANKLSYRPCMEKCKDHDQADFFQQALKNWRAFEIHAVTHFRQGSGDPYVHTGGFRDKNMCICYYPNAQGVTCSQTENITQPHTLVQYDEALDSIQNKYLVETESYLQVPPAGCVFDLRERTVTWTPFAGHVNQKGGCAEDTKSIEIPSGNLLCVDKPPIRMMEEYQCRYAYRNYKNGALLDTYMHFSKNQNVPPGCSVNRTSGEMAFNLVTTTRKDVPGVRYPFTAEDLEWKNSYWASELCETDYDCLEITENTRTWFESQNGYEALQRLGSERVEFYPVNQSHAEKLLSEFLDYDNLDDSHSTADYLNYQLDAFKSTNRYNDAVSLFESYDMTESELLTTESTLLQNVTAARVHTYVSQFSSANVFQSHVGLAQDILDGQDVVVNNLKTQKTTKEALRNDTIDEMNVFDNSCTNDVVCSGQCYDPEACNYCTTYDCDAEACRYPNDHHTCDPFTCLRNQINENNTLCDEEEIMGCTDSRACNWNPNATYMGHVKCKYPPPFRQCAAPEDYDSTAYDAAESVYDETVVNRTAGDSDLAAKVSATANALQEMEAAKTAMETALTQLEAAEQAWVGATNDTERGATYTVMTSKDAAYTDSRTAHESNIKAYQSARSEESNSQLALDALQKAEVDALEAVQILEDERRVLTSHKCFNDENNDGVCDEEVPHPACSIPACVHNGDAFQECSCNMRTEAMPVPRDPGTGVPNMEGPFYCRACQQGQYTETVCTAGESASNYTLFASNVAEYISLHTTDNSTGQTILSGYCENDLNDRAMVNQYVCLDCPAGWYGDPNRKRCHMCERGTYQDEMGEPSCKVCGGEFKASAKMGRTTCSECNAEADPPYGWNDEKAACELCDPYLGLVLNRESGECEYVTCPPGSGFKYKGNPKCEDLCGKHSAVSATNPLEFLRGTKTPQGCYLDATTNKVYVALGKDFDPEAADTTDMSQYYSNTELCDPDDLYLCEPCVNGSTYSSTNSHLPCMNSTCELDGVTVSPFKTFLTRAPVCVDLTTADVRENSNLRYRYALCQDNGDCETSMLALDVRYLEDFSDVFSGATDFNLDISVWETELATSMARMFEGASKFDQPIGRWTTTKVTNMDHMFHGALHFNQRIANWDTSRVASMKGMFKGARLFNQDIRGWDLSSLQNAEDMFRGATSFQGRLPLMPELTAVKGMFLDTNYDRDISHVALPKITTSWKTGTGTRYTGRTQSTYTYRYMETPYELNEVLPDSYRLQLCIPNLVDHLPRPNLDYRIPDKRTQCKCGAGTWARHNGNFPVITTTGLSNYKQYQESSWECVPYSECDYEKQFRSFDGSASEDIKCQKLKDCRGGQFFVKEKTKTSDRACFDFDTYFRTKYNTSEAHSNIVKYLDADVLRLLHDEYMSDLTCSSTTGSVATENACSCGTASCETGEFCRILDNACYKERVEVVVATCKSANSTESCFLPNKCYPTRIVGDSFDERCVSYKPSLHKTGVEDTYVTRCRTGALMNEILCYCVPENHGNITVGTDKKCDPDSEEFYCDSSAGTCSDRPICSSDKDEPYDGVDKTPRLRNSNTCQCGSAACEEGERCYAEYSLCTEKESGFCYQMSPGADMDVPMEMDIFTPTPEPLSLGRCQGHCNSHGDCRDGLECYSRTDAGVVPGCKGDDIEYFDKNVCYNPGMVETTTSLRFDNVPEEGTYFSLGTCEGHCKSDLDCQGAQVCSERTPGSNDPIPGCAGSPKDFDEEEHDAPLWYYDTGTNKYGGKITTVNFCHFDGAEIVTEATAEQNFKLFSINRDAATKLYNFNLVQKPCVCGEEETLSGQWCDHSTSKATETVQGITGGKITQDGEELDICGYNADALDLTHSNSPTITDTYRDGSSHDNNGYDDKSISDTYELKYSGSCTGDNTIRDLAECQSLVGYTVTDGTKLENHGAISQAYGSNLPGGCYFFLSGTIPLGYASPLTQSRIFFHSETSVSICASEKPCICRKSMDYPKYTPFNNITAPNTRCVCAMYNRFAYDECVYEQNCMITEPKPYPQQCQPLYNETVDVRCGQKDCAAAAIKAGELKQRYIDAQEIRAVLLNPGLTNGFCYDVYEDYWETDALNYVTASDMQKSVHGPLSHYRLRSFELEIEDYEAETEELKSADHIPNYRFPASGETGHTWSWTEMSFAQGGQVPLNKGGLQVYGEFPRYRTQSGTVSATLPADLGPGSVENVDVSQEKSWEQFETAFSTGSTDNFDDAKRYIQLTLGHQDIAGVEQDLKDLFWNGGCAASFVQSADDVDNHFNAKFIKPAFKLRYSSPEEHTTKVCTPAPDNPCKGKAFTLITQDMRDYYTESTTPSSDNCE